MEKVSIRKDLHSVHEDISGWSNLLDVYQDNNNGLLHSVNGFDHRIHENIRHLSDLWRPHSVSYNKNNIFLKNVNGSENVVHQFISNLTERFSHVNEFIGRTPFSVSGVICRSTKPLPNFTEIPKSQPLYEDHFSCAVDEILASAEEEDVGGDDIFIFPEVGDEQGNEVIEMSGKISPVQEELEKFEFSNEDLTAAEAKINSVEIGDELSSASGDKVVSEVSTFVDLEDETITRKLSFSSESQEIVDELIEDFSIAIQLGEKWHEREEEQIVSSNSEILASENNNLSFHDDDKSTGDPHSVNVNLTGINSLTNESYTELNIPSSAYISEHDYSKSEHQACEFEIEDSKAKRSSKDSSDSEANSFPPPPDLLLISSYPKEGETEDMIPNQEDGSLTSLEKENFDFSQDDNNITSSCNSHSVNATYSEATVENTLQHNLTEDDMSPEKSLDPEEQLPQVSSSEKRSEDLEFSAPTTDDEVKVSISLESGHEDDVVGVVINASEINEESNNLSTSDSPVSNIQLRPPDCIVSFDDGRNPDDSDASSVKGDDIDPHINPFKCFYERENGADVEIQIHENSDNTTSLEVLQKSTDDVDSNPDIEEKSSETIIGMENVIVIAEESERNKLMATEIQEEGKKLEVVETVNENELEVNLTPKNVVSDKEIAPDKKTPCTGEGNEEINVIDDGIVANEVYSSTVTLPLLEENKLLSVKDRNKKPDIPPKSILVKNEMKPLVTETPVEIEPKIPFGYSPANLGKRSKLLFDQKRSMFESSSPQNPVIVQDLKIKKKSTVLFKVEFEQKSVEHSYKDTSILEELEQIRNQKRGVEKNVKISRENKDASSKLTQNLVQKSTLGSVDLTSRSATTLGICTAKPFSSKPVKKKVTFSPKNSSSVDTALPDSPEDSLGCPPVPPLPDSSLMDAEFFEEGHLAPTPFSTFASSSTFKPVKFNVKGKSPTNNEAVLKTSSNLHSSHPLENKEDTENISVIQEPSTEYPAEEIVTTAEYEVEVIQTPIQDQPVLQVCDDVFLNAEEKEIDLDPEAKSDKSLLKSPNQIIDSTKVYLPLPIDDQKSSVGDSDNESYERPYTDDDIDDINMYNSLDGMVDNSSKHDLEQVENSGNLSTDNCAYKGAGMDPGSEDFVLPPLPPPPSEDHLMSYSGEGANYIPPVRSPTSGKSMDQPLPPAPDNLPSPPPPLAQTSPIKEFNKPATKGFRSVSRPVAKPNHFTSHTTEVQYPGSIPLVSNTPLSVKHEDKSLEPLVPPRPPSASGFVTLLRDTRKILIKPGNGESRGNSATEYSLNGKQFPLTNTADVKITPKTELPEGAVYQTTSKDGEVVHTDTYYPAHDQSKQAAEAVVLERTKTTTVVKAPHHQGIGPVTEQGIPVALKSTVDDSKHWYKNMFKQMHKIEKDENDSSNAIENQPRSTSANSNHETHSSVELSKPTKVGKITDYQPARPYVVENKPTKRILNLPQKPYRTKTPDPSSNHLHANNIKEIPRSPSLEEFSKKDWTDYFDDIYKPKLAGTIWDIDIEWHTNSPTSPLTSPSYKSDQATVAYKPKEQINKSPQHTQNNMPNTAPYKNRVNGNTYHANSGKNDYSKAKNEDQLRQPARAKFAFNGQTAKELGVKKGQTVIVTKRIDDNWFMAETVNGSASGIVPVQYLQILAGSTSPEKPSRNGQAKAKFDFNGQTKNELSFRKGDNILLLKKVDANWYKGKVGSVTGILPCNYVEVIVEPETAEKKKTAIIPKELEAPSSTVSPRSTTSMSSSQHSYSLSQASSTSEPDENESKHRAALLANMVVGANKVLHAPTNSHRDPSFDLTELDRVVENLESPSHLQKSSVEEDFPPPPASQSYLTPSVPSYPSSNVSSHPSTPRLQTPTPIQDQDFGQTIGKYVAVYAYAACNDDEVDLSPGDTVMVVETCDDGWYVGTCERTGQFGTFPGNYVTLSNS